MTTSGPERHLRVELVDDAHREWAAVRPRVGPVRLVGGRVSARQAIVAAFVQGRLVGHACLHVDAVPTAAGPVPRAWLGTRSVDRPFVGTMVEQVMMALLRARARTMGCATVTVPAEARRAA